MFRAVRLLSLILGLGVLVGAVWSIVEDAKRATGFAAFTTLAIVGLALIIAAFLPRTIFIRWFVLLITLLLPLYAFETMSSANAVGVFFQQLDGRSKARVVVDLRRQGEKAFPAVFPTHFLNNRLVLADKAVLPLGGLPNVLTVLCREADGWISYKSDRRGFNTPDAAWDEEDQIVLLGDSFVHGACLPAEKIFSALLRRHIAGTLNLGMSDNGPLLMLATLMEYLPLTRPRAVVWSYYDGNDLYRRDGVGPWRGDLERESANPILRGYLEEGRAQGLAHFEPQLAEDMNKRLEEELLAQLDSAFENRSSTQERGELRRWLSLQSTFSVLRQSLAGASEDGLSRREAERFSRDASGIDGDLRLFARILTSARQRIEQRNARAVFLYLPSIEDFTRPSGAHPLRSQVLEAAHQAGFTVIDMEERFRSLGEPEKNYAFGKRGGHFSALGHQRVAEALLTTLTQASPKPPS